VETVRLAAKKISEESLHRMKEIVEIMRETLDEKYNVVLDKEFHYIIAKESGNRLIVSILTAVSSLMDSFIKEAREAILSHGENKEILLQHHENIYRALAERDEEKAAEVMQEHMNLIIRYMEL